MSAPDMMAALDPQGSAWVGANAGAGKTYILVSRLARLMLDGVAPERILCLTYTRAAAAEMQDRLFELLGQWALMEDGALRDAIATRLGADVDATILARARVLFARALETPGGLRVQTIHGFCESLLKRFPLEAGLSPHFDLLDEQEARNLQASLIAGLLDGRQSPQLAAAMARLTRALAEPDILSLGRQIIDRRAYFEAADMTARLAHLAEAMKLPSPLPVAAEVLLAFHGAHASLWPLLADWLDGGGKTDKANAARLRAWHGAAQAHKGGSDETSGNRSDNALKAAWHGLYEVFFTTKATPRASLASQSCQNAAPDLLARLTDLLAPVAALDGQLKGLANYHLTAAVFTFAEALLAAYRAAKTRRAVLDYEDMIAVTNQLLSGPQAAQWVLYKIDNGLHHILIDEAQDTSPAQWKIISALADAFFDDAGLSADQAARTIFAVGDEKQSIFSFQGAEPTGFDAQRAYFESAVKAIGGRFAHLPMRMSRRSAPEILQAVDLVFADRADGVTADGSAVLHEAHRADAVGHVELWPPCESEPKPSSDEAWHIPRGLPTTGRQLLADKIAAKIEALLADGSQNVSAGDILVLVRSRDVFVSGLTRALKRKNIAVAGSDRMVLLEQIAIADMLALIDFALNPTDDMALAIVLRSPLGGFSETQLFHLAHGRSGSLWQALRSLAATGDTAAQQLEARLKWVRDKVDYLSPYELLAQFLGAQGGHKLFSRRLGPEIDDPLSELLRLALAFEARQAASMQGFLHWLRQGSQEIKRDMEAGGGAVRIMTVHGAKGLEAPIVFLPDTCRPAKKRGGSSERMQFDSQKTPLWRANLAARDPYNAAQVAAADKAMAEEEKRLLYVAMTRARERLYIGGWLGARDKAAPADSWYAMVDSALDETARAALAAGERALPQDHMAGPDSHETADQQAEAAVQMAAPAWTEQPAPRAADGEAYIGSKIFSPSGLAAQLREASAAPAASIVGADETIVRLAAKRGHLIHKLLELLPALPADEQGAAAAAYLAQHASHHDSTPNSGFDEAARQEMVAEALRVMAITDLTDLFSAKGKAEIAITGMLTLANGRKLTLSGQIDRMVETEERVLLVDFKTGTPPAASPSGISKGLSSAYVTQMAAYRELLHGARQGVGGDKPIMCALIWTQNGQIDYLPEAALNDALDALRRGARSSLDAF